MTQRGLKAIQIPPPQKGSFDLIMLLLKGSI